MPLVASPWSNSGLLATCHLADAGPIPHYWPCLFQGKLGQSHAISIVSLKGDWANSMPSAVCCLVGAGAIPCYWPCLFQGKLGQSHAIGIVSLEGDWANSMLSVAPLWGDHGPLAAHRLAGAGPIPRYWPCLFQRELGQSHAIGSTTLEQLWAIRSMSFGRCWANPMLSALSL